MRGVKTMDNGKLTFEQFRELFYTTDDKAQIYIDVLYINNVPYYPEGTFRVIDNELNPYNQYFVCGLIQLVDEIGVVLADR
jgi:hypothetical protein